MPNIYIGQLKIAYKEFIAEFEINEQVKAEQYLKSKVDSIDRTLRKGEYESMQMFNKDLRSIEDEFSSIYADISKDIRTNLWRSSTERLVYKAGDYVSKAISDKAKILKSQLNNLQSSYDKIAADLENERKRKANDIRDIEK